MKDISNNVGALSSEIELDEFGRVVLSDQELQSLSEEGAEYFGAGTNTKCTGTNSNTCRNSGNCSNSKNSGTCVNSGYLANCEGATNTPGGGSSGEN